MAESYAPMREPTYFVLAALLAGPLHGYAIIKRAEEMSGGRVRLATGTLYTALDRLTDEGYVALSARRSSQADPSLVRADRRGLGGAGRRGSADG